MFNHLAGSDSLSSLASFTDLELMVPQLQGRDAPTVIRELGAVLQRRACVADLLPFYQAALNREFLLGTAMNYGLAFPHARVAGLRRLSFALGRASEPMIWGPSGSAPVRLVFLCAVPATEATAYLQLTSGLARLAKESDHLSALLEATDAVRMLEALSRIPLRATPRTGGD